MIAVFILANPLHASLETYGAFKGEHYLQASANAPGAAQLEEHGVSAFAVTAGGNTPLFIDAKPGGTFPIPIYLEQIEGSSHYQGHQTHLDAETRDEYFPDGLVTFTLFDFETNPEATLTLATPALPPIPAVANFAESQAIDPSQPFTLRWNGFAGAGAQDRIWVRVQSFGNPLFVTPIPGAPGALAGSATEVVIPAGTLTGQEGIEATIIFLQVGQQTDGSLPGSTALMGSYRSTKVTLKLEGDDGGSDDGPVVSATMPGTGETNVETDTQVLFQFSRSMAPITDFIWMANGIPLDDASFTYDWISSVDLLVTYAPAFPPNANILWIMGDAFQDTEGNPLEGENRSGFFRTAGQGDCDDGDPLEQAGNFSLTRGVRSLQTGPGTLVPHSDGGAFIVASFNPPTDFVPSGASFDLPSGDTLEMDSFFGSPYFYYETFTNAAAFTEAFPQGSYVARVERSADPTIQTTLNASGTFPPTPELLNHTAAQAIDPASAFTLSWNAFTGAGASSVISLEILDAEGDTEGDTVFSAPNECLNIELAPTATSISLPAGTLQSGHVYDLIINFYRLTDTSEHGASGITFSAAAGASTETTIRTTGGSGGDNLRLDGFRIGNTGRFEATVTGTPGLAVLVDGSSNLIDWDTVTILNLPASGSASFEDSRPLSTSGGQFYRLRAN
ncbi:MAG: hypothetical protein KJ072_23690 [Verrucomicrobia bacterium]|nr:hypothetical protein [Verrucomicrobiota bacterium]